MSEVAADVKELAQRLWKTERSQFEAEGLNRSQFYEREIAKLLDERLAAGNAGEQPQSVMASLPDRLTLTTAALTALAEAGATTDIQEALVRGSSWGQLKPNAIGKMVDAILASLPNGQQSAAVGSNAEIEEAFLRLCEEIGIPATAGAYLEYRSKSKAGAMLSPTLDQARSSPRPLSHEAALDAAMDFMFGRYDEKQNSDCWVDPSRAKTRTKLSEMIAVYNQSVSDGTHSSSTGDTDEEDIGEDLADRMASAGYDATRLPDGTPQFAEAGFCVGHAVKIYDAMDAVRRAAGVALDKAEMREAVALHICMLENDTLYDAVPDYVSARSAWESLKRTHPKAAERVYVASDLILKSLFDPSHLGALNDFSMQNVLRIIQDQPFYPDTHTGMRQQWVKDEIARKVADLALSKANVQNEPKPVDPFPPIYGVTVKGLPPGYSITVHGNNGNSVHVMDGEGVVYEWADRPDNEQAGIYDLCRALAGVDETRKAAQVNPVAWRGRNLTNGDVRFVEDQDSADRLAAQHKDGVDHKWEVTPLYTAPPSPDEAKPVAWLARGIAYPFLDEIDTVDPQNPPPKRFWSKPFPVFAHPPSQREEQIFDLVKRLRDHRIDLQDSWATEGGKQRKYDWMDTADDLMAEAALALSSPLERRTDPVPQPRLDQIVRELANPIIKLISEAQGDSLHKTGKARVAKRAVKRLARMALRSRSKTAESVKDDGTSNDG